MIAIDEFDSSLHLNLAQNLNFFKFKIKNNEISKRF